MPIEFPSLTPHHIGIAVPESEFTSKFKKNINFDLIQGVKTCFIYDEEKKIFIEYFSIEGRAKKYFPGFHHICYSINSIEELNAFKKLIFKNDFGHQLTLLEKSGSPQCNFVVFFQIKFLGIIEINVLNI